MVQPKDPPISFRPGPERLARIEAYAAEHKLSRHLTILLMLDEGWRSLTADGPLKFQRLPPGPTTWPSGALIEPHHTEDPAPKLTLGSAVTFGPQRAKYGERQKTAKVKK